MGTAIDLTGKHFGKLTVIKKEYFIPEKHKGWYWLCKCDCGNDCVKKGEDLRRGRIKSCGCLSRMLVKKLFDRYNINGYKLIHVRMAMIKRCYKKNDKNYKEYGERGITVYDEWINNSITFYEWALTSGYEEGLTLDRINNNGNYEPSNCRWINRKKQANNTRTNHFITLNGVTKTISEWSDIVELNYKAIMNRIQRGWTEEEALTIPKGGKRGGG